MCAAEPLARRLDRADAAVVARLVAAQAAPTPPRGRLTFEVDQRVKGEVGKRIVVRTPAGSDCGLRLRPRVAVGLLLTRRPNGEWLATACSVVPAGELVAAGGEPRGGTIKAAIGAVILLLVLAWSFARLRRGTRPQLPGAPRP